MKIKRIQIIENIANKPYSYEFYNNYIIIYSHSLVTIYDINGQKIVEFEGVHADPGAIRILGNNLISVTYFGNKIFDFTGKLLNKKFNFQKKSVERYGFSYFPTKNEITNEIIVGSGKGGVIGFYNTDIKPLKYIELEKDERLYKIDFTNNKAFIINEKQSYLKLSNFPEFEKSKEFKIQKQNRELLIYKNIVINFGYTSTLIKIDTNTNEIKKFQFHPTGKKGYKEQYEGTYNFGTRLVTFDHNTGLALFQTDKNKCFIYNLVTDKFTELKIYDLFNYNPYKEFENHHLYYAFFKDNKLYTNIGEYFVLWNSEAEYIFKTKGLDKIKIGSDQNFYSINDSKLEKIILEEL